MSICFDFVFCCFLQCFDVLIIIVIMSQDCLEPPNIAVREIMRPGNAVNKWRFPTSPTRNNMRPPPDRRNPGMYVWCLSVCFLHDFVGCCCVV